MFLYFPDLATLELALASSAIPLEMAASPVSVVRDPDAGLTVETAHNLPPAQRAQLRSMGVRGRRPERFEPDQTVTCWAELIPLRVTTRSPAGTFLFQLEPATDWTDLSRELLRQGKTRQSLRIVELESGAQVAFLRVEEPGLFSLLRKDQSSVHHRLQVYRQINESTWIEWGYDHPIAFCRPVADQLLLIQHGQPWLQIPDRPFRSFDQFVSLRLSTEPHPAFEVTDVRRIEVPLRLTRAGMAERQTGWMVPAAGLSLLEEFVASAGTETLRGLAFSVVEDRGQRRAFLLRRPGFDHAVVLPCEHAAFTPDPRLANVMLPAGTRLTPPLVPSQLSATLGTSAMTRTWLLERDRGAFDTLQISESAFRPLTDWVDYVITSDRQELSDWIDRSVFDLRLDGRVTSDDRPVRSTFDELDLAGECPESLQPPTESTTTVATEADSPADELPPTVDVQARQQESGHRQLKGQIESSAGGSTGSSHLVQRVLNRMRQRRATPGESSTPAPGLLSVNQPPADRHAQWRSYAEWLLDQGQTPSALRAWLAAVWDAPGQDALETDGEFASWSQQLLRRIEPDDFTETIGNERRPGQLQMLNQVCRSLTDLGSTGPGNVDSSQLVAELTQYDSTLPIRAAWLIWRRLFRTGQADPLLLSRTRQRLLSRLDRSGLRLRQEFPPLRLQDDEGPSLSAVPATQLELVQAIARLLTEWSRTQRPGQTSDITGQIQQLQLAWALAMVDARDAARTELHAALEQLDEHRPLHTLIASLYGFRIHTIDQPELALDSELQQQLDGLDRMDRYKLDRLLQNLNCLSGGATVNPFLQWTDSTARSSGRRRTVESLEQRLAALRQVADDGPLVEERRVIEDLCGLLADELWLTLEQLETLVQVAQRLLPRLEEPAGRRRILMLISRLTWPTQPLADEDLVASEICRLLRDLDTPPRREVHDWLEFAVRSTRCLRQSNLPAQLDACSGELERLSTWWGPPEGWETQSSLKLEASDLVGLQLGLLAATCRSEATPTAPLTEALDRIERQLRNEDLKPAQRAQLGRVYLESVGLLPAADAWQRLRAVFETDPIPLVDSYTTAAEFSLSHLILTEAAILSAVGDRFGLTAAWSHWLDREEDTVRSRIQWEFRELQNSVPGESDSS